MARYFSALIMFFLIIIPAGYSYSMGESPGKVGYIDLNRLVNESNIGKEAAKEIAALKKQKKAELNAKAARIAYLKKEIQQSRDLGADELKEKLRRLEDASREYKRASEDAKLEIERKNNEIVNKILEQASPVLKEVAKKEGFTMIIKDPKVLGYLDPSVDITTKVVEILNKTDAESGD